METISKEQAIKKAKDFINEVNKLEKKYNMSFNSDTGDVYLTFKTNEKNKVWDTISLGWDGDGTPIKVKEKGKMKAGQTAIDVNVKVEIKGITGEDSDLNGLTGRATHPFAFGCTDKDWIGIYLDKKGIYADDKVNVNSKNIVIIPE